MARKKEIKRSITFESEAIKSNAETLALFRGLSMSKYINLLIKADFMAHKDEMTKYFEEYEAETKFFEETFIKKEELQKYREEKEKLYQSIQDGSYQKNRPKKDSGSGK